MYTDETILTFGRYEHHRICDVPASYFFRMHKEMRTGKRLVNEELMEYVKENWDILLAKQQGKKPPEKKIVTKKQDNKIGHKLVGNFLQLICNESKKIIFQTEKDAKYEIKRIQKTNSDKKPVRAYECDSCGGWHITSVSFEDWKEIKNRETKKDGKE